MIKRSGNDKKWDRSEVKRDALEKGKEELTAEEYRQKAQKQIELLKNQWKIFFRTGIIVVAAFIVMIVASIAWFVSNTRVDATGVAIQPADMPFDLAAAGTKSDEDADRGIYDKLLTVSLGALREIDGKNTGLPMEATLPSAGLLHRKAI